VKLLEDNINTINKSMETWIDASKEDGLEVHVEKTKYMLLYHQNSGINWDIKIVNRSFQSITVQIFGNDSNKSKLMRKLWDWLLLVLATCQSITCCPLNSCSKCKIENIQDFNSAFDSVWVWNLDLWH
jgi:hypothetical protein